jgi:hypothetical protein
MEGFGMTLIEAAKQALEALEAAARTRRPELIKQAITALRAAIAEAEKQEPTRLWLWKNFVEGRPEYWAFDNPFPCMSVGGDPLTLGEPCGWALIKPSVNGRPDRLEQEVIDTVTRFAAPPAQRQWVGLTEKDFSAINQSCLTKLQAATSAESILKEKNT